MCLNTYTASRLRLDPSQYRRFADTLQFDLGKRFSANSEANMTELWAGKQLIDVLILEKTFTYFTLLMHDSHGR